MGALRAKREREAAEHVRSEQRYRRVIEAAQFGYWDWDLKSDKVYLSPAWKAQLGYANKEIGNGLGEFYERCHPEEIADTMALARASLADPNLRFNTEFRLRHKDGSWRWIWSRGLVIRNSDGEPIRMVGGNVDVTSRKEAETALRESDERFRLVANAGRVGFWDWDLRSNKVFFSVIWKQQLGYTEEEIGDDFDEFFRRVHPDETEHLSQKTRENISGPARTFAFEFRMLHKNGSWRWIDSRGIIIRNAAGEAMRLLGTHLDVTDRKETEAMLRAMNSALEQRVAERTFELASVNSSLQVEIGQRKRLEAELLAIAEREQRRIGRDLHDDLGQQLTAIMMQTVALKTLLQREGSQYVDASSELLIHLRTAIVTTRNLAKGLYPLVVEQGGLKAALEDLAARTEIAFGRPCIARVADQPRLPRETTVHLYRIAQEAVNNAVKHGNARKIEIDWVRIDGRPTLSIVNDGIPFKQKSANKRGLGLYLIENRAKIISAEFKIYAGPDGGCQVICTLGRSVVPPKDRTP